MRKAEFPRTAALLLGLAGCGGMSSIPIVGAFAPSSQNDSMRQARASQQDVRVNYMIRPGWKNLIDEHKFRSALAYIESHKEEIGEANQKTFTEDTQRECLSYLNARLLRFRRNLTDIKSQRELAAMKADDFASTFNLPAAEELILTLPAYEWARGTISDLDDFRSRKPAGEGLLKSVAASTVLPADEDGEFRWFETIEALAFQALGDAIRAEVEKSQDALRPARDESHARAESLRAKWGELAGGMEASSRFRKRVDEHAAPLAKHLEGFPVDLRELESVDIEACLSASKPETGLQNAERTLKALESRPALSRESRQRLYTMIVTVVSLRTFLSGKEEADAVGELKGYSEKLRRVGGPGDTRAYGARVQKVFDALLP